MLKVKTKNPEPKSKNHQKRCMISSIPSVLGLCTRESKESMKMVQVIFIYLVTISFFLSVLSNLRQKIKSKWLYR